ncbi:MAG: aminotransferase class V-fold PLP-dependent enzyme [Myxococcales bacterium]|nr:aminotransferase class V-fold PLP-dependent enzyme [Myxococcales bacterium]
MSEEEYDFMRSAIGQRDALRYETPASKMALLGNILRYDLPLNYRTQQNNILRETDHETLNELASRLIQPGNMAIVVVGDRKGQVGIGYGKANAVPEAIRKGTENGHKNLTRMQINGNTIPHEAIGKKDGGRVLLRPASQGTGVVAGGGVRAVLDDLKHPALLFVDGVSSIGSIDFRMDEWGVDCAVTGSQKGLMLPAGLGIVGVSQKALEARKQAGLRRCYFDFEDMRNTNADGWFPYTPALGLLYGLRESLDMLFEEGLDNVFARHHRLAEGVRAAVRGWGLSLCAKGPEWESDTVSAIYVPEGHDAKAVIHNAYHTYNLSLGAGLMQLAGKVFRIGHLGDLNDLMCLGAISGVEMAMRDAGIPIEPGSGVAAAQESYRKAAAAASK